jgi:putative nucleotidyltransferase with HDIG domain
MGLRALSEVAIAVAVQGKVFRHDGARELMGALWRHSVAAATCAKEIARLRRRNVESAFLCGLLHDVGKPIVLSALLDVRATLRVDLTPAVLHAAMDEFHAVLGASLAQQWRMPAAVQESIRYHHDRYAEAPTSGEAAMITCLADHLAHLMLPMAGRTVTEEQVRGLAVLESLNIYPDELEALFAMRPAVQASVEAIG